ncbi:hypothetical protein Tco_0171279, partial [Tanacetum coccineum]
MWKVTRGSQVIARGCKRGTLYMVKILVTEWSGWNLIEDVNKEAERKKLSVKDSVGGEALLGTCKGSRTKGSVEVSGSLGASGSSVNRLSLSVCTDM